MKQYPGDKDASWVGLFREGTPETLVVGISLYCTACVQWSRYGNTIMGSAWGLGVLGRMGKIWGLLVFWGKTTMDRGKKTQTGGSKEARNILELSCIETIWTTGP